jgi:hypothetical protein
MFRDLQQQIVQTTYHNIYMISPVLSQQDIGHKSGQIWQTNHFEKVDTEVHNKFKKSSKTFLYLVHMPQS